MNNLRHIADRVSTWNDEAGQMDDLGTFEQLTSDDSARGLALALVEEELAELSAALLEADKVEAVDAVCDILFTLFGLTSKAGLNEYLDEAFDEVCRSNESKLRGFREILPSGKLGKGSEYTPPDIAAIVNKI